MVKSQPLAVIFKRDYVFLKKFFYYYSLDCLIYWKHLLVTWLSWMILLSVIFIEELFLLSVTQLFHSLKKSINHEWAAWFEMMNLIIIPLMFWFVFLCLFFSFSYLIVQRNHQANIENSCWKDSKRNQHMILSFTILLIIEGRASYFDGRRCVGLDTATKEPLSKGF